MSEQIKDGGPAFPFEDGMFVGGKRVNGSVGVSMRDYFAAKAMPVVYGRVESGGFERVAKLSYELADAMLAAREQQS